MSSIPSTPNEAQFKPDQTQGPQTPVPTFRLDQSTMSQLPKLSVQGMIELLRKVLKSNFPTYWKWLKLFCQGRLSKIELDANLKKLLPTRDYSAHFPNYYNYTHYLTYLPCSYDDLLVVLLACLLIRYYAVTLHNFFIMAILRSAFNSFSGQRTRKLTKVGFAARAYPYRRKAYAWDSTETNVEFVALSKRMNRAAQQHQIQSVQPEAVHLVLQALEKHLARVISAVYPQVCAQPDIEDMLGPDEEQVLTSIPGHITGPDIERAATRRPNILGDNPSLLLQRFTVDTE